MDEIAFSGFIGGRSNQSLRFVLVLQVPAARVASSDQHAQDWICKLLQGIDLKNGYHHIRPSVLNLSHSNINIDPFHFGSNLQIWTWLAKTPDLS